MSKHGLPDEELCAYADRRLGVAEASRIEQCLAADAALAARIDDWRAQGAALHALFDPVLAEAPPERLLRAARGEPAAFASPARSGLRRAAVLAWIGLGLVIGYGLRGLEGTPDAAAPALTPLAREAAVAHAVYVPEVRHPVEVGAEQQEHLVGWLSKRLGMPLKVPRLDEFGYALVGGRLLPSAAGPGAQFMFEDGTGQRLTLYLNRDGADSSTAFRFADQEGIGVFYWVDRGTGYALSGQLPREHLLDLANAVYRQLDP